MDLLVTHVAPLDAQREETESVSLRDLIDEYANDRVAVVKLDIEGNECRAMSAITLEEGGNLLVLFEDHGRDVAHTTTRFLLIADRWSHPRRRRWHPRRRRWRTRNLSAAGPVLRCGAA
jgi:hypothetical protein